MEIERARLARWLAGVEAPAEPWTSDAHAELLVRAAQSEGVVCLLERAVRGLHGEAANGRWLHELRLVARQEVLGSMRMESEYRRVIELLCANGVAPLVLKGSALAYWAYPEPHLRACGDLDLLVSSRDEAERVVELLAGLGYRYLEAPGTLTTSALMCIGGISPEWSLEVDIHWRLNHSAVFASALGFDELMASSIALPRLAPGARGLGPAHAMLHAAVHRARNLENGVGDLLKWLYDFVALGRCFSRADWDMLLTLAAQKELAGVTLNALEAAKAVLATPIPEDVLTRLRGLANQESLDAARLGDWRYMQRQAWKALPGTRARLRWVWQRLFPGAEYLRQAYGMEGSYPVLLRERLRRFWLKWRSQ
ncbi:nucleotidyltransferase family protein [Hydrogenophaga sp. RWCD_12]|uniref:nucleotidyltransferase family protein n=1 Tax=Hydrogenophaga sp. RWCD_12 TaxID=3391190 RepID=UPI003984EB95